MSESESLLQVASEVLRLEAQALHAQARLLDSSFIAAVNLILACSGRVAVSGMGKSGHIGRKIAATLASTGTPAFFIHPAEAGHGDLGMFSDQDVLLAISNSGNTAELESVLSFCKRHDLPIIAITHGADSLLARQADICILLNYENEACLIGCAPTTSTTLTLALGDALAMALLKARGFTATDFKEYHPGGALGHKLLFAHQIMHTESELPLVEIYTPLSEILLEMTGKGFGCSGVIDDQGNLIGIITDGDLRRHMNRGGGLTARADAVMTKSPVVINRDCAASKALNIMQKCAITSLFVVEDNKPVGIVHMHDCLRNRA